MQGEMLLYYDNKWFAVYHYVNGTADETIIPDGLANPQKERVSMREALTESELPIYLQQNKRYLLLSNDNTLCKDVPLSMFDLFVEQYEQLVLRDNKTRPIATFWLYHNVLRDFLSHIEGMRC